MKCLLIDDNKDITDALSFFFENEKIPCTIINNGKDGLEAIKNQDHDLVLLDLAMPEFSGYDILNELKDSDILNKKKILVITASSMDDKKEAELLSYGVKQIITKPVTLEKLKATIEKYSKS